MISRMEKRILAIVLAFLMCVTTGYTGTVTANAAEFQDSEITEISEGVKNETTLDAGAKTAIYRFIPQETGTYHFYSVESGDTYGAIYDASQNLIKEASDDGNSGVDFSIETELTAGETYYLGVNYYLDVDSGKITWIVEKEETKATEDVSEAQTAAALEDSSEGAATVASAEEEASKWNCKLNNEKTGLVITGYSGEEKDLVVPKELEYEGTTYPVTEIGDHAFTVYEDMSGVKQNQIYSVKIPSTVKVIGVEAFYYNTTLASVDLSEATGLENIKDQAFYSTGISEIVFPENLKTIGDSAFGRSIDQDNTLSVVDFSKAKSLEIIGDSAFRDIPITEITFPENLKTIGTYAFYNDTSLIKADFSKAKKLETIGEFAFGTCKNMADINLEEATALKTIGDGAFNSIGTESIVIPDSVETIYETQMQTFSNDGVYGFTIYGKVGSVAEEYANNSNERVTFYNLDGVYLEKPKEATYVEVADGTYQVETIWPKNPKDAGVIWESSDKSIATVDSNGLVTRAEKGNGIVTITAIRGEFSDSIDLKISTPAKTSADGKWKYRVLADNTVALCGYAGGTDKKVTMPDSIDGRKVTRLQAFYMRKWDNVKQLILPKTVTRIEANALEEYQQEIIIPEGNVISYIGDNAFGWAKVYGPENFIFKGYLEDCGGYYLDKKIYMSEYGPIKWYEDSAEKQGYVVNILHIPSSLPENTQVEWSSSRPDMVNIKDGSDGETRIIGPYNNEYGKVTVTVSAGEYQESREFEFENQPEKLEDGDYTYSVIDEDQKTAALVSYKGTCTDEAPIKVPEKINGYTITTIKNHAYNNVSGNRKIVYVIPDTVTEIEQYALLGDAVVVGTEGTEAERFVKRYGNQLIFCDRNKMVLNTSKTEIARDTSMSEDELIAETTLYVAYAPEDAGKITWTSNNETVATVLDGHVQAHKAGIAVITATYGELSASCVVEVSYTNNGFKYKELADGTVEITGCDNNLSEYNYEIPSTIAGKKVTVLGEGPIWTDQKVIIPDTVTTVKKNAIESESWINVIEVSMPASVTKIEDGAFADRGMGYEIYGPANSKAKSYAEKYDYIDFYEDGIVLAGDFYDDGGMGVGDVAVGEQMNVGIVHMPMDVNESDEITWTSSDPKSVSVTANSDNPQNAVIEALAVTNKRVEISCKVGDYETVVFIEVYTESNSGEYTYTMNLDGTINIVSYEGDETTVTIPSKLDKKTVVSVAGFEENDTLEKITIPSTVTAIQYGAFYNCANLSTVTFNSGSELEYIGEAAFAGSGITSIAMPNTVSELGSLAFKGCSRLSSVTLSNSLEGIENGTFRYCVKLSKITIPASVTYIDDGAFAGSGLTSISVPKNVESIGEDAFRNCKNLKTATVANQAAYVGDSAFYGCDIASLSIAQTEVGRFGYANNPNLTTLTLKEGVTTLEYRSFYRCENLENITFPKSLEKIGAASFDETKWMEKQPDGPVYVNSILINYKGDPENVAIADGTKYIESTAFDAKKNLTSVVIADSVTTIRTAAFVNCSKLERIVIPNTVTTIEKQAMGYSGMYAEGSEGVEQLFISD